MPVKKSIPMRSILVELPEDKMLALVKKAREADVSVHVLVANTLLDWLGK